MAAALADKLGAAGHPAAAITALEAALTKSEDASVLNNLANLLATSPDKSVRNPTRALTAAQRASALTGDKSPAILDTLAATQAANGDFNSAAITSLKALELARASKDNSLIPLLEKYLAAYRTGRLP